MMMNDEVVNCTNKALVAYFLKNGIHPITEFLGRNDTIVFQYKRSDTQLLYEEWMNAKEEQ